MFECFQLFFSVFLGILWGSEGQKFLGVLGGFPWYLPKHQGKEDQGIGSIWLFGLARQNRTIAQSLAISALTEPNRQKSRRKKGFCAWKSQPEIANR